MLSESKDEIINFVNTNRNKPAGHDSNSEQNLDRTTLTYEREAPSLYLELLIVELKNQIGN